MQAGAFFMSVWRPGSRSDRNNFGIGGRKEGQTDCDGRPGVLHGAPMRRAERALTRFDQPNAADVSCEEEKGRRRGGEEDAL